MAAWRLLVRAMYYNGGGPFTTRQLEDELRGQKLPVHAAANIGLVEDVMPGKHGRLVLPKWRLTQLGRDLVEGRALVDYDKSRGLGKALVAHPTWLNSLPRLNKVRLDSTPQFPDAIFTDSLEDSSPAILSTDCTDVPPTAVNTVPIEYKLAGEQPCLHAPNRLNQRSPSTDANHPWRPRPRPL